MSELGVSANQNIFEMTKDMFDPDFAKEREVSEGKNIFQMTQEMFDSDFAEEKALEVENEEKMDVVDRVKNAAHGIWNRVKEKPVESVVAGAGGIAGFVNALSKEGLQRGGAWGIFIATAADVGEGQVGKLTTVAAELAQRSEKKFPRFANLAAKISGERSDQIIRKTLRTVRAGALGYAAGSFLGEGVEVSGDIADVLSSPNEVQSMGDSAVKTEGEITSGGPLEGGSEKVELPDVGEQDVPAPKSDDGVIGEAWGPEEGLIDVPDIFPEELTDLEMVQETVADLHAGDLGDSNWRMIREGLEGLSELTDSNWSNGENGVTKLDIVTDQVIRFLRANGSLEQVRLGENYKYLLEQAQWDYIDQILQTDNVQEFIDLYEQVSGSK